MSVVIRPAPACLLELEVITLIVHVLCHLIYGCLYMLVLNLTNQEITSAMSEKEILGKGGYGTVYRGYMRSTRVAISALMRLG